MQYPTAAETAAAEPALPCVLEPDHPGDHLPGHVHDIDPDFPVCPAAAAGVVVSLPGQLADALAKVLLLARRHIAQERKIRAVQLAWIEGPLIHQDAKETLFRTWPVLATAVAELAGETPTGGRR